LRVRFISFFATQKCGEKMKKSGKGIDLKICPRCFREISWIERREKGDRTYYYAVHYGGYSKVDGRVKRFISKCYLGADEYVNVERFQNLGLSGVFDRDRFRRYVRRLMDFLSREDLEWIRGEVEERLSSAE
jgi:hypothetical protein